MESSIEPTVYSSKGFSFKINMNDNASIEEPKVREQIRDKYGYVSEEMKLKNQTKVYNKSDVIRKEELTKKIKDPEKIYVESLKHIPISNETTFDKYNKHYNNYQDYINNINV